MGRLASKNSTVHQSIREFVLDILPQKMAAVESASAEERERMRATYKQRLKDMDTRLKVQPPAC